MTEPSLLPGARFEDTEAVAVRNAELAPRPSLLVVPRRNATPVLREEPPSGGRHHLMTNGSRPRMRARLIALASSRCFLAETAVMRDGTILPRSEM